MVQEEFVDINWVPEIVDVVVRVFCSVTGPWKVLVLATVRFPSKVVCEPLTVRLDVTLREGTWTDP